MSVGARADRRRAKQAYRDAQSGAGPVRPDAPLPLFPGATSRFALFAEAMLVGVVAGLVSVPLVTAPAALAAGTRHLRRYVSAEDSSWQRAWADFRQSLLGGIGVAVAAVLLVIATGFTLLLGLVETGAMRLLVQAVAALGLLVVGTALLLLARLWEPTRGWTGAIRSLRPAVEFDAPGVLWVGLAVVLVGVLTWQLPLLAFPALGVALLAVVAVEARGRTST